MPRPTPEERFWRFVAKAPGCWLWTGAKFSNGYGAFTVIIKGRHTTQRAHRFAYELATGRSIPDGLFTLHRCDNRACVRFAHLFLGTHDDNMADMVTKRRSQRGAAHHRSNAKVNANAVRTIRRRYRFRSPTANMYTLAAEYGVSVATVSNIVHRKVWQHVA